VETPEYLRTKINFFKETLGAETAAKAMVTYPMGMTMSVETNLVGGL
jgi:hypothetical protein